MLRSVLLAGALVCLASCGGRPPPSYQTALGMQVWDPGQHFSQAQVDKLAELFLDEFSQRWSPDAARERLSRAEIEFLDVHTWDSYGRTVAGTTDPGSLRITVAAKDYTLFNCALAHELVHYLDMSVTGYTDETHVSWNTDGTYPSLERVRQNMRLAEQAASEPILK